MAKVSCSEGICTYVLLILYIVFFVAFFSSCTWQFLMPPFLLEDFQPSPGISFSFPSTNPLHLLLFGQSTQLHWPPLSILLLANFQLSVYAYRELSATKGDCPGTRTRILQILAPFVRSLTLHTPPSLGPLSLAFHRDYLRMYCLSSHLPQRHPPFYSLLKRNPKTQNPFCRKSFHVPLYQQHIAASLWLWLWHQMVLKLQFFLFLLGKPLQSYTYTNYLSRVSLEENVAATWGTWRSGCHIRGSDQGKTRAS